MVETMTITSGLNHLGLAVKDLKQTTSFFVDVLGWSESGYDESYPRTSVTDGELRLTLWQIDKTLDNEEFDRRKNIGLHHLALNVDTESELNNIYQQLSQSSEISVEFSPELVGNGPRKHMMCYEPGGIRIEFIWQGS